VRILEPKEYGAISLALRWALIEDLVSKEDIEIVEKLTASYPKTSRAFYDKEWNIMYKYSRSYLVTMLDAILESDIES
jgi:hypothetical protein